jgi:Fe-S cluster assembly protein SufD
MSVQPSTPVAPVQDRPLQSRAVELAAYLQALIGPDSAAMIPDWLKSVRSRASALLQEQVLPTTQEENWRFTDLTALYRTPFQPAKTLPSAVKLTDLADHVVPDVAVRVVFVNGVYAPHLSTGSDPSSDLTFSTLGDLEASLQAKLGQQQGTAEVFTALNTAKFEDLAVLRVTRNQAIEGPIHLLFLTLTGETPWVTYPRCLVIAEAGSSATLIEDYGAIGEGTYFTNGVTEIWLEDNAQLDHHRIQRENSQAFHIGKTAITQARDSRYRGTMISLGGRISRHNPELVLAGEQTETHLNGLTVAVDQQLADTHSAIAFTQPYGIAQQLHKCIAADRARAVFNGKIVVPKAAQQTNATQLSRNLLLSAKARVDTKPQLEIVADNVKCAHGATVSQLDEEEVFYLQSRGLDRDRACDLLVEAFATETIAQVPLPVLRQKLIDAVLSLIR